MFDRGLDNNRISNYLVVLEVVEWLDQIDLVGRFIARCAAWKLDLSVGRQQRYGVVCLVHGGALQSSGKLNSCFRWSPSLAQIIVTALH